MITRIISGGNTGADQAGLRAAKRLGIATGGKAPSGWRTESGPSPWLADYNLVESVSADYRIRTKDNVSGSDGTVIFGVESVGSSLTQRLCRVWGKYWMWLQGDLLDPQQVRQFNEWVEERHIHVLNVAGNRESVNPGIGQKVEDFLFKALREQQKGLPTRQT